MMFASDASVQWSRTRSASNRPRATGAGIISIASVPAASADWLRATRPLPSVAWTALPPVIRVLSRMIQTGRSGSG